MDGWLSMVFLGPKAICESCLFIWASGFHSLEAELEAQPNKASRLAKKKSCHEENDSKEEESLSCLLLVGCHLIYVKDLSFERYEVCAIFYVYDCNVHLNVFNVSSINWCLNVAEILCLHVAEIVIILCSNYSS
jgi:hypothetical protein